MSELRLTSPNVQLFQPAKRVSDSSLGWSEAELQEYQPSTGPARDADGRAMPTLSPVSRAGGCWGGPPWGSAAAPPQATV
jgi:hypothetical protein